MARRFQRRTLFSRHHPPKDSSREASYVSASELRLAPPISRLNILGPGNGARTIPVIVFVFTLLFPWASLFGQNEMFLLGGDVSALPVIESRGGVFKKGGIPRDALEIMRESGANCFRLRLFVSPSGEGVVVNDLAYTSKLASRIRQLGARILLDFHFSDTWADPGDQWIPKGWSDLSFSELADRLESYTCDSLNHLSELGLTPEYVQLGNEINNGLLWPAGKIWGSDNGSPRWDELATLLAAAVRGVREAEGGESIRIVLHISSGGEKQKTQNFFEEIEARNVSYDVIGLSFYPWWHGSLDALAENLAETSSRFQKDILVVETAFPYRPFETLNPRWKFRKFPWPFTPSGQRDFLRSLIDTVIKTPGHHGLGVLWWYPESIPVTGLRVWNHGATALFDDQGEPLPALLNFLNR